MKQVFENILRVTIGNLFHYRKRVSRSYKKVENHFNGPVYFIERPKRASKHKVSSLPFINMIC